jgi:hypothetical protein
MAATDQGRYLGAQDRMSEDRRTIKNWAARLSAPDEQLTLEEARTLAAIAATDRLLEMLTSLQDIQMRLTRIELFVAATIPGYDAGTQALVNRMLAERTSGGPHEM